MPYFMQLRLINLLQQILLTESDRAKLYYQIGNIHEVHLI